MSRCLGLLTLGGLFPQAAPENVLFLAAEEQEIVMRQRPHEITNWLVEEGLFLSRTRSEVVEEPNDRLKLLCVLTKITCRS